MPLMPYQLSTCRQVFHAKVAMRSPGCMPKLRRAPATCRARPRTSAQLVRCFGPSQDSDTISFEELKEQIRIRDEGDSNRAIAPLKKASDAIEIDTTSYTLDQVVRLMAEQIITIQGQIQKKDQG
jgi:hypothetical protein